MTHILVCGGAAEECRSSRCCMLRLKQCTKLIKKGKCVFLAKTIEYLGYRVDQSGLHTQDSKVAAITKTPWPKNVYTRALTISRACPGHLNIVTI